MSFSALTPVTVDRFAEELMEEPKWYDLGVFLKVPIYELDTIQTRYYASDGQRRCLIEMYKCLENKATPICWKSVIEALERMKNNKLACNLDRKYVKQLADAPQSSLTADERGDTLKPTSQGEEDGATSVINPEPGETSIDVSGEVAKAFCKISDSFVTLVLKLRRSLCKHEVTIDDIQTVLFEHYELKPLEGSEATLEKIFLRLHQYYCVLHYHILVYLAHIFLSDDHNLQQMITQYDADVEKFKNSTTLKSLMCSITKNQSATREHKTVKLKVREFWEDVTLKKFQVLVSKILKTLYAYFSQIKVERGCICISWVIPDIKMAKLITPQPLEFIKAIGVVSLHIGDTVIYDMPSEGCELMEAAMLQAIELKNPRAVELLLAVGCDPEVATHNRDVSITITAKIEERSSANCQTQYICVFEDDLEEAKEKMHTNLLLENDLLRKRLEERTTHQEETEPMEAELEQMKAKVLDLEEHISFLKSHQIKKEAEAQILQYEQRKEIEALTRKLKEKEDETGKLADQTVKLQMQLLGNHSSPVTINDFATELLHEQDWYALGMILGLPETKLKEIGANYRLEGIETCLRELYKFLLILNKPISWENIAMALFSLAVNNQDLAHRIFQKYCHGQSFPYTSQQLADRDSSLIRYLTKACRHGLDEPHVTFDQEGFFLVSEILRLKRGSPASEDDIRRVVAGNTLFMLDEGPPLAIRANWGHSIGKISQTLKKERELHSFLFDACCYGALGKELYYNEDGYVRVDDLLSLKRGYTEEDVRKAVKYSFIDRLILKEGPPLLIKPTYRQRPEGHYIKSRVEELFGTLKKLCREGSKEEKLNFDQDGYVPVTELLPLMSYCGATEEDVRKAVDGCPQNRFTLKEGPPLQIKANWGHKLKEVTAYNLPTLKSHDEAPLAVYFVQRREWAKVKREGLCTRWRNKIEFSYQEIDTVDEKELLKKYGTHQYMIVLDLEKALKNGLEFLKVPRGKLICLQEHVPPEYFKRII